MCFLLFPFFWVATNDFPKHSFGPLDHGVPEKRTIFVEHFPPAAGDNVEIEIPGVAKSMCFLFLALLRHVHVFLLNLGRAS